MNTSIESLKTGPMMRMILFIAGNGPNSVRARYNLQQVCETHLNGRYRLDVVDVLEETQLALQHGILVTPALRVTAPDPPVTVLGDLADTPKLLKALRLQSL